MHLCCRTISCCLIDLLLSSSSSVPHVPPWLRPATPRTPLSEKGKQKHCTHTQTTNTAPPSWQLFMYLDLQITCIYLHIMSSKILRLFSGICVCVCVCTYEVYGWSYTTWRARFSPHVWVFAGYAGSNSRPCLYQRDLQLIVEVCLDELRHSQKGSFPGPAPTRAPANHTTPHATRVTLLMCAFSVSLSDYFPGSLPQPWVVWQRALSMNHLDVLLSDSGMLCTTAPTSLRFVPLSLSLSSVCLSLFNCQLMHDLTKTQTVNKLVRCHIWFISQHKYLS